jgi:hypothetical protein
MAKLNPAQIANAIAHEGRNNVHVDRKGNKIKGAVMGARKLGALLADVRDVLNFGVSEKDQLSADDIRAGYVAFLQRDGIIGDLRGFRFPEAQEALRKSTKDAQAKLKAENEKLLRQVRGAKVAADEKAAEKRRQEMLKG